MLMGSASCHTLWYHDHLEGDAVINPHTGGARDGWVLGSAYFLYKSIMDLKLGCEICALIYSIMRIFSF